MSEIDSNFLSLMKTYNEERLNTQSDINDTEVLGNACEKLISFGNRFFKPEQMAPPAISGIHMDVNEQMKLHSGVTTGSINNFT